MEKLKPNSDIELLRSFAIIMVLIQHYPALYFWSDNSAFLKLNNYISFWSGVDLFLCISGFVVSCGLINLIDNCKSNGISASPAIKSFFIRRIFRLMPTSLLWITIMITMTYTYNISGAFGQSSWNILQAISVLTYNYNYLAWYMQINKLPATFGPFWSLNLEEQFYFILPFFVLFTSKKVRPLLLIAIIAIQFPIMRQGHTILNFRTDALAWGVLLSILYMNGWTEKLQNLTCNKSVIRKLSILFLAGLMLCIPALNESGYMVGVLALFSAMLVLLATFDKALIYCPARARKALLWVGARSYSIYLIHMPVIYFIQETTARYYLSKGMAPTESVLSMIVMMISSLTLTALVVEGNFRFIESPLRNYGRKIAKRVEEHKQKAISIA